MRARRSAAGAGARGPSPAKTIDPLVGRTTWTTARPVVDLPHPDSPTRPSVSPGRLEAEPSHGLHPVGPAREVDMEVTYLEERVLRRAVRAGGAGVGDGHGTSLGVDDDAAGAEEGPDRPPSGYQQA